MTNLTITVDERTLKSAWIRALEEGTSVNAVLREHLETYAGANGSRRRRRGVSGSGGRTWTREDVYEERLGRYGRK